MSIVRVTCVDHGCIGPGHLRVRVLPTGTTQRIGSMAKRAKIKHKRCEDGGDEGL